MVKTTKRKVAAALARSGRSASYRHSCNDRAKIAHRHADVAFTMKQYVQPDLEADREVANTLADLIIGGLLVTEVDDQADAPNRADGA